ncbi:MAG: hypothetical protein FWD53_13590 [Phycisphaerales bacterium]|nr:hypothetical protein [Phycisphaerales bacterium]
MPQTQNLVYTPGLNLPPRKTKGLIKLFGGLSVPFYTVETVMAEGTPLKPAATAHTMEMPANGEGAKVIGLALQETYDESAFGQLRGYYFVNDTRQRLDGAPIGVLCGAGYAMTNNYAGDVKWGDQGYVEIDASDKVTGKMTATSSTGNKIPVVFEGIGKDGDKLVRIRFDFPLA